ncbi:COPI associated protein-domain-containing protein [Fennellomyces sp. T-0311]|nr:COPI associated protein-domain-containing protein [Fennellomyces sp. T-0311]
MGLDISLVFRVVNIVAAACMVIGGVGTIIEGGFPNFIQGIFCIIFGVVTGVFEFRLPGMITQYASFMFSFLGRGIFYIFIGCITLNYHAITIACGVIVIVIGAAYVVLNFISNVQAPSNMQKAAFEESLGYSTRPYDEGGANPSGSYPPPQSAGSYPTKTYVSDGPTV